MGSFRKSSYTKRERFEGKHRFEHWYRNNSVYFITSRVSDGSALFDTDTAQKMFWNQFDRYSKEFGFQCFVRSLLNNHYHLLGYLQDGSALGSFMQRFHGSIAKLANDLHGTRLKPFWRTRGNRDYFDGCIRDELQLRRAYRYTLQQSVRARLVKNYLDHPNTFIDVPLEDAIRIAKDRNVYLPNIRYPRYDQ